MIPRQMMRRIHRPGRRRARGVRDLKSRETARWVDLLEDLYRSTVPFLDSAAHRDVYARISASRCYRQLPAAERDRVDLLDALATREPAKAARIAERLLESGRTWAPAEQVHLLQASVSGRLAAGDIEGAKGQWARYGKAVDGSQLDRLATRLLLSWIDPDYRAPGHRPTQSPAAVPASNDKGGKS